MRRSRSQYVLMGGAATTAIGLLLGVALWRPARPREGAFARPPRELQWQRDLRIPAPAALQAPGFRFCAAEFGGPHGPWETFEPWLLDEQLRALRDQGLGGIAVRVPLARFQQSAAPQALDEAQLARLTLLVETAADHGLHTAVLVEPEDVATAQLPELCGALAARLQAQPLVLLLQLSLPAEGSADLATWLHGPAAACAAAVRAASGPPFALELPPGDLPERGELPAPDLVSVAAGRTLDETLDRADTARSWANGAPVLVDRLLLPDADDGEPLPQWMRELDARAFGFVLLDPATPGQARIENASFADGLRGWTSAARARAAVRSDAWRREQHLWLPAGSAVSQELTAGDATWLSFELRAPSAAARLQIGAADQGLLADAGATWQRRVLRLPAPPAALRFEALDGPVELDGIRLTAQEPMDPGTALPQPVREHARAVLARTGQLDTPPIVVWSETALAERLHLHGLAPEAGQARRAVPLLLPWHASELEIDLEPLGTEPVGPCEVSLDGLPVATLQLQARRARYLLALDASLAPGPKMVRIHARGAGATFVLRGLRVLMPGPRDERRWVLHVEPDPVAPLQIEVRVATTAGEPASGAELVLRFRDAVVQSRTGADGRATATLELDPLARAPGPLFVELRAAGQRLVDVRRVP